MGKDIFHRLGDLEAKLDVLEKGKKSEIDAAFRWELLSRAIKGIHHFLMSIYLHSYVLIVLNHRDVHPDMGRCSRARPSQTVTREPRL